MAATTFTTWSDLYVAMQNALADFVANRMQVAEFELNTGTNSRRFKYRTFAELKEAMIFVKQMADMEVGSVAVGRTYAKNGGGGRW